MTHTQVMAEMSLSQKIGRGWRALRATGEGPTARNLSPLPPLHHAQRTHLDMKGMRRLLL